MRLVVKVLFGLLFAWIGYSFYIAYQKDLMWQESWLTVTKEEYGDAWAFTKDSAVLKCYKDTIAVMPVVVIDKKPYGLTGWADAMHGQGSIGLDMDNFNTVWLKNPDDNTSRIDISPFKKRAEEICSTLESKGYYN